MQSERVSLYMKIVRVFVIRTVNIIFYTIVLYTQTQSASTCPESIVGQEFWMLIILDCGWALFTSTIGQVRLGIDMLV